MSGLDSPSNKRDSLRSPGGGSQQQRIGSGAITSGGSLSPMPSGSSGSVSTAPAVTAPTVTTSLGRKPSIQVRPKTGGTTAARSSLTVPGEGGAEYYDASPAFSPTNGPNGAGGGSAFPPPAPVRSTSGLSQREGSDIIINGTSINGTATLASASTRLPETWAEVFDAAKIPEESKLKYLQIFEENEMPQPQAESLKLFLDNQFLSSLGIELAGHRAKILVQIRQIFGLLQQQQQVLHRGRGNSGGPVTSGSNWAMVANAVRSSAFSTTNASTPAGGASSTPASSLPKSSPTFALAKNHAHHGIAGMPSHHEAVGGSSPKIVLGDNDQKPIIDGEKSGDRKEANSKKRKPKSPRPHRLQLYQNVHQFKEGGSSSDGGSTSSRSSRSSSRSSTSSGKGGKRLKTKKASTAIFMQAKDAEGMDRSEAVGGGGVGDTYLDPLLGQEHNQVMNGDPNHHGGGDLYAAERRGSVAAAPPFGAVSNSSIVDGGEFGSIKFEAMRYAQIGEDQMLREDIVVVNTYRSSPSSSHKPFTWIDVSGRDRDRSNFKAALENLTTRYGFSESLLLDMDLSVALPQVLTSQEDANQYLIILRVATERTDIEEDSLHELTNRWMVAINLENYTIATIHRVDSLPLAKLRLGWQEYDVDLLSFHAFICKIFDDSIVAYIDALQESEFLLDKYEGVMLKQSVGTSSSSDKNSNSAKPKTGGWNIFKKFAGKSGKRKKKESDLAALQATANFGSLTTRSKANVLPLLLLEEQSQLTKQRMNQLLYHLHRRCSVYSRMLSLTQAALESAYSSIKICSSDYAEQMSRSCGELALKAESLHDNCQNLLNLHLSLVSFRTNELMNILTIFSAFFIPLTFISGVYGMNFVNMPELQLYYGYYYCLGAMFIITVVLFLWFRSKGLI